MNHAGGCDCGRNVRYFVLIIHPFPDTPFAFRGHRISSKDERNQMYLVNTTGWSYPRVGCRFTSVDELSSQCRPFVVVISFCRDRFNENDVQKRKQVVVVVVVVVARKRIDRVRFVVLETSGKEAQ